MKISRLLPILLVVLCTLSCSKDVEFEDPVQARLEGNWVLGIYLYDGHTTRLGHESFTFEEFTGFAYEIGVSATFGSSNSYTANGTYLLDHIVTYESGNQTLQTSFEVVNDQGTWNLEGNTITIVRNGEEMVGAIAQLTEDRLEIRVSTTSSEIIEDLESTTVNTSLNESYTFLRVD